MAKSLDVVGDRWTLLIVRELALRGPCRYTDLRNGLPGIATNLLADRLRELEQAGVVAREDAPPPIATTLFHLTPRGEELRPVLDGLFRWGLPLMTEQKPRRRGPQPLARLGVELILTDRQPRGPPVTIELRTGDQPITIQTHDGAIRTRLGPAERPDPTLTGRPARPRAPPRHDRTRRRRRPPESATKATRKPLERIRADSHGVTRSDGQGGVRLEEFLRIYRNNPAESLIDISPGAPATCSDP